MAPMADHDAPSTGDLNATYCATLVDEWVRAGVAHAVVAPGSRSTPMALALADRSEIALHVHHDERAAAFMALGIGLATGAPALVLTTSGTAAVELHPAVVEAHQAAVPLMVLTADRPPELHHVGAPQSVDQQQLYGSAVRWFVDPGAPAHEASGSWRSLAARVVAEASGNGAAPPGPVHLNLPFREPLLGAPGVLPPAREGGGPWHRPTRSLPAVDDEVLRPFVTGAPRVVVVVGAGCGSPGAILDAAERAGWPVVADARSGCRLADGAVVTTADTWLRHDELAASLRPDLVVRLGEPPASKVLAGWLARSGAPQLAVHRHGAWFDPDRQAAAVLHADPAWVLDRLAALADGPADAGWRRSWADLEVAACDVLDRELEVAGSRELTEPGVARTVVARLRSRADAALVVASSMPVRDVEWYGGTTGTTRVLANRGANGIDGVVSTALGVALARRGSGAPTVALVGDVAFLHDANALVGIADRDVDLTVVVVDNDGGGIFSFLPQASVVDPERFERLFGTPHGVDLVTLATAHGLPAEAVDGEAEGGIARFGAALDRAIDGGGVRMVVARTDRHANVAVHERLHRAVLDARP
jgi:2-succinyl-5-enolpyruvyl-6-hydroxy-3-cyclohexene-1-carboxylate synthase